MFVHLSYTGCNPFLSSPFLSPSNFQAPLTMVTMKNPLSQLWQIIHKDTQLRTIAVMHRREAQQEWKDPDQG